MQFLSYISIQDVHIKLVVQGPVVASKHTCVFFFLKCQPFSVLLTFTLLKPMCFLSMFYNRNAATLTIIFHLLLSNNLRIRVLVYFNVISHEAHSFTGHAHQ